MSRPNNSSISTLTYISVNSKNEEVCSLQIPIKMEIKYSESSRSQERDIRHSIDVTKTQIKSPTKKPGIL